MDANGVENNGGASPNANTVLAGTPPLAVSAGAARVLFAIPAATAPGSDPRSIASSLGGGTTPEEARRRVGYLAVALGVVIIVSKALAYVLDIAELEASLRLVAKVAPRSLGLHSLLLSTDTGSMLVMGLPNFCWSVGLALLVPLCGFLGAKQGNSSCMCCFFGCNLLGGCCAICAVLFGLIGVIVIGSMEPAVADWLRHCDPDRCTKPDFPLTLNMTIDCLATTFKGYKQRYPNAPHLPDDCPPLFLTCKESHPGQASSRRRSVGPPIQMVNPRQLMPAQQQLPQSPAPVMAPVFSDQGDIVLSFDPDFDPIASCRVERNATGGFHTAVVVFPLLIPKLVTILVVRVLLAIPFGLLSCLGFCWGKDLYDRLSVGYAHVEAPNYVANAVQVQPPHVSHPQQQLELSADPALPPSVVQANRAPLLQRPIASAPPFASPSEPVVVVT